MLYRLTLNTRSSKVADILTIIPMSGNLSIANLRVSLNLFVMLDNNGATFHCNTILFALYLDF
jgi:hypothetical protein